MTIVFWIAAAGFAVRIHADGAMLEALKRGDKESLRRLVSRHHAALVGLAQTIVGSRATAEDVAQETWIAVVNSIAAFDGRSALSTWIIAILLNKARTHARREGRYVPFADSVDAEEEFGPAVSADRFAADGHWVQPPVSFDGLDPERIVAGRELWRHVGAVIETLPPAQRSVMIMRDVEGRDAGETCDLLGLTAENQRILLHRARARVRSAIEDLARGG
ncbi:RNA polymerase sigma factor [Mongoliimonas terrestris]|uniref:RNA polymerase sigma factor n=1 Tax=Mongoliimonas terrestris TaxID=1709001 RepID=UPI000AC59BCF|nr:RNA polymerase sigma factor [Mongoliimonas terrestris]